VRVGVLTTSYPRDADDPAGGFVAGFAGWLRDQGAHVEVIAADARRPLFYRGGAPQALRGRAWLGAAAFSSALWRQARARARRWDTIVSHWLVPSAAVGMALAGGRPHLAIAHGSDVRLLARLPGGRAFVRTLARRAELIYVAEALRVDGTEGRVVPMGIDVDALASGDRDGARARLGLDGVCALFLGRLSREKGADRAIATLPDGVTLLIAGAGPERGALEAQARALAGRVRFLGEVRGREKRDLLAAADLLVAPSREEGAPTVILEALAAGLPVVATRAGGIPELVSDGETAILCAPDELAAAIARLRDEPATRARLAVNGRARAARHDWRLVGPTLYANQLHVLPRGCAGDLQVSRI
jgi:glycosyltransferase involved in cell wall biosynthesis